MVLNRRRLSDGNEPKQQDRPPAAGPLRDHGFADRVRDPDAARGGARAPLAPIRARSWRWRPRSPAVFSATLFGGRSAWGAPGRLRLYLVLWPFFIWWTLGLLFAALAPLGYLVAAVAHAPRERRLGLRAGRRAASGRWPPSWAARGSASTRSPSPACRRRSTATGSPRSPTCTAARSPTARGSTAGSPRSTVWTPTWWRSPAISSPAARRSFRSWRRRSASCAARDGVFACMGNHDYFTDGRGDGRGARAGGADAAAQPRRRAPARRTAGSTSPASTTPGPGATISTRRWPTARPARRSCCWRTIRRCSPTPPERGVALTLSGHTHGGQLGVPFLAKRFNLARSSPASRPGSTRWARRRSS